MKYKAYDKEAEEWIYSNQVKTKETAKDDDWWFEPTSNTFCITETYERFYEQNGQTETIKEYKEIKGVPDKKILTPIPLTEEWLVKTGMFKNSKNSYSEIDEKNNENNNIPLFEIDIISGMFFHKRTGTRLKTVHHYQNLYFALTNKELKQL